MKFYSLLAKSITPYVAGEQPQDKQYIKLNTNENPYPPTSEVSNAIANVQIGRLAKYPDPNCTKLKEIIAKFNKLKASNVFVGNGSDEVLSMAFASFFNPKDKITFADITYSFYPVYADYYSLEKDIIPLQNYKIIPQNYYNRASKGIIIANPNAPTSIALTHKEIEDIIANNLDKIVIVDQAYIAFCNESVVDLVNKYDNLVIVETLSKSYSLAGIRCGYALANASLISAFERIKDSYNSYTVDTLAQNIAIAGYSDRKYYNQCTKKIVETRDRIALELKSIGIKVEKTSANFLFITIDKAQEIYLKLKSNGILVRYFSSLPSNLRVTVGTDKDMDTFISTLINIIND